MNAAILTSLVLLLGPGDNDVKWNSVSHVGWLDRRPLCPINGEAFAVYIQAERGDLTGLRVNVNTGVSVWIDAVADHDRGPYTVWRAQIPATASTTLRYYFELTDGTDVDYYSVSGMSDNPPVDGGFLINYATLEHAPLGATPASGGVVFRVWAPSATSADVRGEFNGWGLANPMTRVGSYFAAFVPGATSGQMYKYFFSNANWRSDPRAKRLNPTDNYNSFIQNPLAYNWQVADFQTPPFDQMVMYELHVGTFAGRNDPLASGAIPAKFADVAAHAADLAELGVNMVLLMPFTEFPFDFSAGYNPVTAWAPEWKYGTPDELKAMVDALHAQGVGVMLDIVWNHFSPSDNYLWQYDGQIYFDTPDVQTPWGSQADFDRAEVRDYYVDSALYWLDEFRIDGFRMDATDYMDRPPQNISGYTIMQRLNDAVDVRARDKIVQAEQLPDDAFITRPTSLGGAGFDTQWHDAFVDNLRQEIFDAATGDPEMWKIANIINGGGAYLENTYVSHYLELHDEAWPSSGGQRMVRTIDTTAPYDDIYAKGRTKLGQGIVMFAPGIPIFHQGTEWLEDTNFGGGSAGGADRIDWSKKTTYAKIYRYYQDMIAIRMANAAFRSGSPRQVFHLNESGNVIAFQRYDGAGNVCVVIANFSNINYTSYILGLPQPGNWYELLNSQATQYDGNGMVNATTIQTIATPRDGFAQSATIAVPQMGMLVLRWNVPPGGSCPGDLNNDRTVNEADLGILLGAWQTSAGGDLNGDGQTNESDLGILLGAWQTTCP
ncbi:MAG: alpha-amylase family glycosyl hydrolase [Phycisphaerae bacterium]